MVARRRSPTVCEHRVLYQAFMLLLLINLTFSDDGPVAPGDASDDQEKHSHKDSRLLWIYQHDPVKIGHVQHVELEPGVKYEMTTMARNPPIFVIPDFLSDEECELIKSEARGHGFGASTVVKPKIDVNKTTPSWRNDGLLAKFDADSDGSLNLTEANALISSQYDLTLGEDELQFLLRHVGVEINSNDRLDEEEVSLIPGAEVSILETARGLKMQPIPEDLRKAMKRGKFRESETLWLSQEVYDPEKRVYNRVAALTRVHPDIISSSERLHVVRYNSSGHYHAHLDSFETDYFDEPSGCHHTFHLYPDAADGGRPELRLCRFLTLLYYLNEPEEGGQTAFPVADNETFTDEGELFEASKGRDIEDLTNHCTDSNLVIEGRKGMAVLWYNHHVENGWIGEINDHSLHGGCEVIRGEKWIANHWLDVDHDYDMQEKYIEEWRRQGPTEKAKSTIHRAALEEGAAPEENDCTLASGCGHSDPETTRDEL